MTRTGQLYGFPSRILKQWLLKTCAVAESVEHCQDNVTEWDQLSSASPNILLMVDIKLPMVWKLPIISTIHQNLSEYFYAIFIVFANNPHSKTSTRFSRCKDGLIEHDCWKSSWGQGKDWLVQYQDNMTEWEIGSCCQRLCHQVEQHYKVIITAHCHKSVTMLIEFQILPGLKTPTNK